MFRSSFVTLRSRIGGVANKPALFQSASFRQFSVVATHRPFVSAARSHPSFSVPRCYYATETPSTSPDFAAMIKRDKVVVFMKGTPDAPQCGFSNTVCQILDYHGVPFGSVNVLADEAIRSGIKEFSQWPTIPQVFMNGEFVGGCDILIEMHKSGDLVKSLADIGIKSIAPPPKEPESSK